MAQVRGMKTVGLTHRLQTDLPRIGIRPTIDGRYGGVRESLEDQTMGMATRVAELIRSEVRHACGLPVDVVIAPTCIGGAAEAALCETEFERQNVRVSLTVTPCWCYGSETIDLNPQRPKAIWGFNGTERPGAVYLAAALAGHSQKGLPAFGIYGQDVQDADDASIPADVAEKIVRFARCGLAVASMKGTSYLAMGGTSMGIAGSIVDHDFFQKYFGIRVESIDLSEFVRRIERGIYDKKEYARALKWVKANCAEGTDYNPKPRSRKQKDREWEISILMTQIARDLMIGNPALEKMGYIEESRGHNALLGGFQGQRQWTDHFPNGDFCEAILNSSFDWNGIRQPFTVATENDSLNGVSMLFSHLLTGTAQLFADVRTYWSPAAVARVTGHQLEGKAVHGILHLINSGPSALDWTGAVTQDNNPVVKPFWDIKPREVGAMLDATKWCAAITEYFPGGGWSSNFLTRGEMPLTMCRINLVDGLGPVLQIAEGHAVNLPPEVHRTLDQRTNPSWPTTWFAPRLTGRTPFDSVYAVMNNWGANHGAICYGHIGADLITLASMLRIPVDMHNVEDVFRPSAWSRFGAMEPQGADYRACAAYGPLY